MGLSYRISDGKSPRAERELSAETPRLTCPLPLCHHLTPAHPSAQVPEKGEQLTPLPSISQPTFGAGRNKGHERTTNCEGPSLRRELDPAQLDGKEPDWIKGEEGRISRWGAGQGCAGREEWTAGEAEAGLVSGSWPAWRRSGPRGAERCLGPNQVLEAQSKTERQRSGRGPEVFSRSQRAGQEGTMGRAAEAGWS